jgi:hypothetical protein
MRQPNVFSVAAANKRYLLKIPSFFKGSLQRFRALSDALCSWSPELCDKTRRKFYVLWR